MASPGIHSNLLLTLLSLIRSLRYVSVNSSFQLRFVSFVQVSWIASYTMNIASTTFQRVITWTTYQLPFCFVPSPTTQMFLYGKNFFVFHFWHFVSICNPSEKTISKVSRSLRFLRFLFSLKSCMHSKGQYYYFV